MSDDYECDATSLNLPNRAAQVDSAISPGTSGWAGWKSALWILNYLQVMHDSTEAPITQVADSDLVNVGVPGNTVIGTDLGAATGTFLGSSDIEGFQAGMMLTGLDNEVQDWLTARMTRDGTTLVGFPDLKTALAYDTNAPLQWFPHEVAVAEAVDPDCSFPRPSSYSIRTGDSELLDLDGLLGTYASLSALTDTSNATVGGSQPALAYFDGDPFPSDDGMADGEATLHDRALALMPRRTGRTCGACTWIRPRGCRSMRSASRPARRHAERPSRRRRRPTRFSRCAPTRRSLSDRLVLYLNTKPDTATLATPIDTPPVAATAPMVITDELNTLITSLSNLFYDHLTDVTGRAWPGWDTAHNATTSNDDTLDAHTAAVRGLLVAFLSSGDTKFRDRALAVYQRVESVFWDPVFRLYRTRAGDTSNAVTYTPVRFGLMQAMLRDTYELVATNAGQRISPPNSRAASHA